MGEDSTRAWMDAHDLTYWLIFDIKRRRLDVLGTVAQVKAEPDCLNEAVKMDSAFWEVLRPLQSEQKKSAAVKTDVVLKELQEHTYNTTEQMFQRRAVGDYQLHEFEPDIKIRIQEEAAFYATMCEIAHKFKLDIGLRYGYSKKNRQKDVTGIAKQEFDEQ